MLSKVPPQGIRVLSVARRDAAVAREGIRTLRSFVSIFWGLGLVTFLHLGLRRSIFVIIHKQPIRVIS